MQWYPHYPGDYMRDTAHLSMIEDGAYRRLLDHYYSSNANVDANASRMHLVCRAVSDDERAAVDYVVSKYFTVEDGLYHHERADKEIEKAKIKSKKASTSANKRWGKRNANADANALRTDMLSTSTSTSTSRTTTKAKKRETPQLAYEIAAELLSSIHSWKPDFKKPTESQFETWAADCDKAIRLDNRTELKMRQVISWISGHEGNNGFTWRANILSGKKLRAQFDKLEMAMVSETTGIPHAGNNRAQQRRSEEASRQFPEHIEPRIL